MSAESRTEPDAPSGPAVRFCYRGQAPSKSNFRRGGKDWRRRWQRIKSFEEAVGWRALQAGGAGMLRRSAEYRCRVDITAVNQRADPDNITKSVLDALEGVCFVNDREVASSVRPLKDSGDAYLAVTVRWECEREETA